MNYDNLLTQDLTIWTAGAKDLYGVPTYTVQTTKCRWEQKQIKSLSFQGNEIISNAVVYLNEDLNQGDFLYQGISAASSPVSDAKEVRNFSKSPDLDGISFIRKAIL